jgi:hypothetical protein
VQRETNLDSSEIIDHIKTIRGKVFMHCISKDSKDYVRELEQLILNLGGALTPYQELIIKGVTEIYEDNNSGK